MAPSHELFGHGGHPHPNGMRIALLPPGWGPAFVYSGDLAVLVLMPFKLIGYVTLAYLIYGTVLDATESAIGGLFGVLSCVSCTWPVLASLVSGVMGSTAAITSAVYTQSYGLSTAVFVATVLLLRW